jgi:hypothetical protein
MCASTGEDRPSPVACKRGWDSVWQPEIIEVRSLKSDMLENISLINLP